MVAALDLICRWNARRLPMSAWRDVSARASGSAAVCLAIVIVCTGCAGEASGPGLDIETLRRLDASNTTTLMFEERNGDIFVTVVDKSGDGHIHTLIPDTGMTSAQALELLRQKQAELEPHP
jgi:hypothetical protein